MNPHHRPEQGLQDQGINQHLFLPPLNVVSGHFDPNYGQHNRLPSTQNLLRQLPTSNLNIQSQSFIQSVPSPQSLPYQPPASTRNARAQSFVIAESVLSSQSLPASTLNTRAQSFAVTQSVQPPLRRFPTSTLNAQAQTFAVAQSGPFTQPESSPAPPYTINHTSDVPQPPLSASSDKSTNLPSPDSEGSESEDDDAEVIGPQGKKQARQEWTSKDIEKLVNAVHSVEPYSFKVGAKSKEAWAEVLDVAQRLGGCQNRSAAALRKKMGMIIKAAKNGNSRLRKQLEKDGLFIRLSGKIDKIDDAMRQFKVTDEAMRESNKQAQDEKKAEGEKMRSAMLAGLASRSLSKRTRENTPTDESDKENADPDLANSPSIESISASSRSAFKKRRQGDHFKELASMMELAIQHQDQQHRATLEEARLAREQTNLALEEVRTSRQQQTDTTRQLLEEMRRGREAQEHIGLQMVDIFREAFRNA